MTESTNYGVQSTPEASRDALKQATFHVRYNNDQSPEAVELREEAHRRLAAYDRITASEPSVAMKAAQRAVQRLRDAGWCT